MEYKFADTVTEEIKKACDLQTADERRTALRKLAQLQHETNNILTDDIMSSIIECDLIKDNYPKFRGSPSALIGMLPEEVLILMANDDYLKNNLGLTILEAIENPHMHGVPSIATKSGFQLGLHKKYENFIDKDDSTTTSTTTKTATTKEYVDGLNKVMDELDKTTTEKGKEKMNDLIPFETLLAIYDCLATLRYTSDTDGHAAGSVVRHEDIIDELHSAFPQRDIKPSLNALVLNRKSKGNEPNFEDLPPIIPLELEEYVIPCAKNLGIPINEDELGPQLSSSPTQKGGIGLDPSLMKTADQVLSGMGATATISELLAENNQVGDSLAIADKEIDDLKKKVAELQSKSIIPQPTKVFASTAAESKQGTDNQSKTVPSVDIKWKKASEVFPDISTCDFEVPIFNWTTPHPEVPEIDPNYMFRGELVANILYCLLSNKKGYISGHTGTGKTTLIEQICAVLKYPFKRINFDSEVTRMDLVGREVLISDGKGGTISKFVDGVLPKAVSLPCVLCLDEIDFIRPDVAYVLQRALESNGFTVLEDGDRFVQPHEMFRIMATGNTKGQGDDTGAYQGARHQSLAFLDRFSMFMTVPYLDEKREVDLIISSSKGFPIVKARELVKFANEVREAFTNGSIYTTVSVRGLLTCADAYSFYLPYMVDEEETLNYALETSILNRCTQQDFANISEIATRVFTGDMEFTYQ